MPNGGTSYMELKQAGETVTSVPRGFMSPGLSGTLHGNKLHLQGSTGRPGREKTITYDATVSGDKFPIRGNNPNGEMADGILERVTRDEMYPARLPLPTLRELPDTGLVRTPAHGLE